MASFNRIIMIGNLTRDPEYKQLASGQAVCRLGIASNRSFKNRSTGAATQEVCFVDIDVWGPQAESCRQYLQKGRSVLIEGRLKLDTWQDNDGQKRSKHSIVADSVTFLSAAGQAEEGDSASYGAESSSQNNHEAPVEGLGYDSKPKAVAAKPAAAPRGAVKAAPKRAADESNEGMGEVAFKDEQPFEDDLPF